VGRAWFTADPGKPLRPPGNFVTVKWLLAVPLLALAWPPLYNRDEPRLLGVPFFYAYQLLVVVVAAACMVVVARTPKDRP
jgi:hypothetical protein